MNNKCVNLKQKFDRTLYCKKHNKTISFCECKNCVYKQYNNSKVTKIKGTKHKLTKLTEIPISVKEVVWNRDNHKCIFCHKDVPLFFANSHYIKRSHLGLGIEQNIFSACLECHNKYDDSIERENMKEYAKQYLISKYNNWSEDILVYKK